MSSLKMFVTYPLLESEELDSDEVSNSFFFFDACFFLLVSGGLFSGSFGGFRGCFLILAVFATAFRFLAILMVEMFSRQCETKMPRDMKNNLSLPMTLLFNSSNLYNESLSSSCRIKAER